MSPPVAKQLSAMMQQAIPHMKKGGTAGMHIEEKRHRIIIAESGLTSAYVAWIGLIIYLIVQVRGAIFFPSSLSWVLA